MPRISYRPGRVAELLRRELMMLIQTELQDPRVRDVNLSNVKMSLDLRHARIYFTTMQNNNIEKIARGLNHAAGFLRRRIASKVKMRVVPELFFIHDQALHKADYLTQLINSVKG